MAHNSHYILVKAEDEEQAEYSISSDLNDFGTENNYWRVRNIYNIKTQKEEVNKLLKYLNKATSKGEFEKVTDEIEKLQQKLSSGNNFVYYMLSRAYERLYEISCAKVTEPLTADNIVNSNDFYSWKFDEFGFTNMIFTDDENENENTYLIEIDMHS